MKFKVRSDSPINKKARRGFRGYPIATVAFYGPHDERASKVAVGILLKEDAGPEIMERWFSDSADLRNDTAIAKQIAEFVESHGGKSVVMTDRIIGCPHEKGIDYPDGATCPQCPQCPFWANRDRWTGEIVE